MIKLSHVFDEQTFIDANHGMWWRRRKGPRSRYLGLAFLAALPVALWLSVSRGMHFTLMAAGAANLLHWFGDWPLTRAMVRRRFAQMPSAGQRISWEIGEDGLKVISNAGEAGKFSWDNVTEAFETPRGFIIAQPHNVTHWLPRAAFASEEDIETLRGLIARKVGRKEA